MENLPILTHPVTTAIALPVLVTFVGVVMQLIAEHPITRKHWLVGKDFCLIAFALAVTNIIIWSNKLIAHQSNESNLEPPIEDLLLYTILVLGSIVTLAVVMALYRGYVYQQDEAKDSWHRDQLRLENIELKIKVGNESGKEKDELKKLKDKIQTQQQFEEPKFNMGRLVVINLIGAAPLAGAASFLVR